MALDPNRWTLKTQEAINDAISRAAAADNPEVTPDHLVVALLEQTEGVVLPILEKVGASVGALRTRSMEELERLPQSVGSESRLSRALNTVINDADESRAELKDEYLSTEHLLLALSDKLELSREHVFGALASVRGSHRVTSQNPEDQYQALEKYGRDLTEAARQGKLDPVIGRDEEIRRTIQVLSRRTKNNPVLIGEPGVGKTAIIEGLAQRIAGNTSDLFPEDVPDPLANTPPVIEIFQTGSTPLSVSRYTRGPKSGWSSRATTSRSSKRGVELMPATVKSTATGWASVAVVECWMVPAPCMW